MKFQLERIALFSDAVFAIAITLMMIEIKPPHLEHTSNFGQALARFLQLIPTFAGTIISFYIIGIFWKRHHLLMKYLVAYDSKVILLNLSLLLSIAFIPFSTAFVFENIVFNSPLPMLVYNLNYIVACIINYRLVKHVLNPANGLSQVSQVATTGDVALLGPELLFQACVFAFVALLGFVNPMYAPIGYAAFSLDRIFIKPKKTPAVQIVQETAVVNEEKTS